MLTKYRSPLNQSVPCSLEITANARKGIIKWAKNEHAFFSMQEAFQVYIEKQPTNRHGNMSFSIFFDNKTNDILSKRLNDRVAVMECVYKNEGFLVTGFQVRGRREPVETNRRHSVRLKFLVGRSSGITMPIELYTSLRELPIAQDRSEYVKKRIASWEGYLRVEERNADVADVTATFSRASLNEDFSKVSLVCKGLQGKQWQAIKGFSAKFSGLQSDIGSVVNVNRGKQIVEIELNRNYKEMARRNEWQPNNFKEVVFSNFAELSQVKRLRRGFKDLEDGLAANANLERVLFEERPVVRISKKQQELVFHNELNEFQQQAVTGAMTSNDLYVIQGPPGTGKTTVISEICHQNVKAGLRTLVASQANLAVDNALGRLFSHQDIRILRYGRTESIEEEGKKFIEENVALNWKIETERAISDKLKSNNNEQQQLETDLTSCELELKELQSTLVLLEEKISLKEQAQIKHLVYSKELTRLKDKIDNLKAEQAEYLAKQEALKTTSSEYTQVITRIEQILATEPTTAEVVLQMDLLKQATLQLGQYINYRETLTEVNEIEASIVFNENEIKMKRNQLENFNSFINESRELTKIDLLEEQMATYSITVSTSTKHKMNELYRLIDQIKSDNSTNNFDEWKKLNDRLVTAIEMIEGILKQNGFLKQVIKRNENKKYKTADEIHGLIDQVGRYLVDPANKKLLETRSYSAAKYDHLEKIGIALELLNERKNFVQSQGVGLAKQQQAIKTSKDNFDVIKIEVSGQVNRAISEVDGAISKLEYETDNYKAKLVHLSDRCSAVTDRVKLLDRNESVVELKEELATQEKAFFECEEKQVLLKEHAAKVENLNNEVASKAEEISKLVVTIEKLVEEMNLVEKEVLTQEENILPLLDILKGNPEEQREETLTSYYSLEKKIEKLKINIERLPITHALQKEWLSQLTSANDYDLDEIRKLYVEHANVIGTTCVASARRDFMEEYPTFDVVIIDEVSKATPPELLLPMLKGKKIILVGDHHQLPPLMGQDTMEELLEESDNKEVKNELKKLLEESLFERLFRTLPAQNKTMLGIQYRMHESIMETITPFYEEGNYSLQCGLTDSDSVRDHLIESTYVERKDHLLWFDMPNEPKYFEEKVKGGTSRFNQSELDMTSKLLTDLNTATKKAKNDGIMKPEDKKSVGVISFYGEQVKRIDRLIQQELDTEHLHIRTGSVDKFQGMEMDIIILSFVRNHQDKGGDIGFARDYRRLNVALSRARELLIIVGSAEMFTVRAKHSSTKEMYGRLVENIKAKTGFRNHLGKLIGGSVNA